MHACSLKSSTSRHACCIISHHNCSSLRAPAHPQEHNPSALARLLRTTEATKSRFLDRKFLRRQQKAAGASARGSRFWYLDLDTWQASTTGAATTGGGATAGAGPAAARAGGFGAQQAAAAAQQQNHSVPVDDSQVRTDAACQPAVSWQGSRQWQQQAPCMSTQVWQQAILSCALLLCSSSAPALHPRADALCAVGRAV